MGKKRNREAELASETATKSSKKQSKPEKMTDEELQRGIAEVSGAMIDAQKQQTARWGSLNATGRRSEVNKMHRLEMQLADLRREVEKRADPVLVRALNGVGISAPAQSSSSTASWVLPIPEYR
mmetsp:Transcript_28163/g.44039  ORF Transcript_28163/g.44039 Transcript_28163/m.44039 type:complete len:124 (+) Transcript_28163:34-405(+)